MGLAALAVTFPVPARPIGVPVELLRSEKHADGLWHAAYPTATLTLCARSKEPQAAGRPAKPDCLECVRTARRFDLIDGSAPDRWKLR